RSGLRLALPLLLALLAACTAPRTYEPAGGAPAYDPAAPTWVGEPLSWAKLEGLERWLAATGPQADPYWRREAELELAEGRLLFARADLSQGQANAERVATRFAAAREGFERVVRDPLAGEAQRRRALQRLEEGLGSAPPPAPPASREGLVTRADWGAHAAVTARLDPVGGPWRRITVHHSDEVPGVVLDGSLGQSKE